MATVAQTKLLTAEEFMAADLGEGSFELVRGEIVRSAADDAGTRTCLCEGRSDRSGTTDVESGYGYCIVQRLGRGRRSADPDTVRGPDVCFYSHARWPESQIGTGLPPVPPDLVVEVVSPRNRPGKMRQRRSRNI